MSSLPLESAYFWFALLVVLVPVMGALDTAAAHLRLWWEERR